MGRIPALASPGAAHRGVGRGAGGAGEARGGRSLLGDVQGMCSSAGDFFQTVGGQYQQALGMYEFALVCALALALHDSPDEAKSRTRFGLILADMGEHEEALVEYQQWLKVFLAIHGQEHPDMAGNNNKPGCVMCVYSDGHGEP